MVRESASSWASASLRPVNLGALKGVGAAVGRGVAVGRAVGSSVGSDVGVATAVGEGEGLPSAVLSEGRSRKNQAATATMIARPITEPTINAAGALPFGPPEAPEEAA